MIDTESGRKYEPIEFRTVLVGFTKNGNKLFIGGRGFAVYDFSAGSLRHFSNFGTSSRIPDERLVHCAISGKHVLINPANGEIVSQMTPQSVHLLGQSDLSPDNKTFAVVAQKKSGRGYGLEMYDVASGRSTTFIPLNVDSYSSLKFSHDGDSLLLATSRTVEVVDHRRGRIKKTITLGIKQKIVEQAAPTDGKGGSAAGSFIRQRMSTSRS